MPRVGFEPTISAGERPESYALDRAATGTGRVKLMFDLVRVRQKKLSVLIIQNKPRKDANKYQ